MGDEKLVKRVDGLLINSEEAGVRHLKLGCFKDEGYNFRRCKSCFGYEMGCDLVLDSLFRDVYGNIIRII